MFWEATIFFPSLRVNVLILSHFPQKPQILIALQNTPFSLTSTHSNSQPTISQNIFKVLRN